MTEVLAFIVVAAALGAIIYIPYPSSGKDFVHKKVGSLTNILHLYR